MEGLEEIYRQIVEERGYKFLGFFHQEKLRFLEELLDTDLGIRGREAKGEPPRNRRPFIGRRLGDSLEVCFLTENKKKYKITLDVCEKMTSSCSWIGDRSYAFYDQKRGYGRYLFKVLGEGDYVLCGRCDDLEIIDKLRIFEI